MNVPELYQLVVWVERELAQKRANELFNALVEVLNHNVNSQPKQPIEAARNALVVFLKGVEVASLSVEQLKFLEQLKLASNIGETGASNIEKILLENQLDIATAASRIATLRKEVSRGIAKAKSIQESLSELIPVGEQLTDEALVRVSFQREAAIANVADLKKWSNEWLTIGRGIAMVHGKTPQDVRVVGATTGSLVIELAATYEIVATISAILLAACALADKVLELLKKAEEFKGMKLKNAKLAADIEKEADEQRKIGIEEITRTVTVELGRQVNGEERESLERSVERLVAFVQKGGEIDCVMPEAAASGEGVDEAQKAEVAKLREQFKLVRVEEKKLRRLDLKVPPSKE